MFEGLAVGLQCEVPNIAYLSIGMTIHSITTLLCLGFNLIISRAPQKVILQHFAILAVTSPIGVTIGMAIGMCDTNWNYTEKMNIYMEALSAGNIMYITFFEILSKEKKKTCNRFLRNSVIMIGFAFMCYLEVFTFKNIHQTH
ncbi:hypothetical protein WA026_016339 [Henosepilachna vigintioctopunctata]|uniref:Uncharacterized protein n=1 Tax=Henosepilachna vigintioctopunctata TaxID=420089 RepID=A0AAW1UFJ8_9CUCU